MLLKSKYKQILLDIFSGLTIPVEVWAYGSRVNGSAHEGSDLDLVIITPTREKVPVDILMELKDKIRDSNIPILVELFDWARLPESFHLNIESCHEVLFASAVYEVHDPESDYLPPETES
jgi:uncharacterized protein